MFTKSAKNAYVNAKKETDMAENKFQKLLNEYIELSRQIRLYSAPQIEDIKNANEYRSTLMTNFTEIGNLSEDINLILSENVYPLLKEDRPLSDEERESLIAFSKTLLDPYKLTNLDPMICYMISNKLVEDADSKHDDRELIFALDRMVDTSYVMMKMALRLTPCSQIGYGYRDAGLKAATRLLTFLDKNRFASLPDEECKHVVLTNSRYITSLLYMNEAHSDDENWSDIELLQRSLELADDPFYREQAPNYNWDYHVFRTRQYIASYTERLNARGIDRELLESIYDNIKKLIETWKSDEKKYGGYCTLQTIELYQARAEYLTERISGEQYKKALRNFIDQAELSKFDIHDNIANLFALDEYLLALKQIGMDDEDKAALNKYYKKLSLYIHRMPKIGSISFVASILSYIIKDYVDYHPGGFEESCMQILLAMHPPTYVHSLAVSELVRLLTSHLLKKQPERFIGFEGTKTKEEVLQREQEILDHAEHAALCHDIGKIFVIELIMTYGRKLNDEEFDLIYSHADIGAYVLRMHRDTKKYAWVAMCHHYYFNELDMQLFETPTDPAERTFIDITCCADSLDAATDAVGRSYKKGKTFEEFRDELDSFSGTRYAPYVADLFHDEEVEKDIKKILSEGREENYRRAYDILLQLTKD